MKLKAPKGCGSVSFNGLSYPVVDGLVDVSDEAVEFLEPGWGFTLAPQKPDAPESKTEKVKGPQAGTPAPR